MSERLLVIFIDALPYYVAEAVPEAAFLHSLEHRGSLVPGVGFSINLWPELFAGLTPDELGFFNTWTLRQSLWRAEPSYEPSWEPSAMSWVARLVDRCTRRPQIASRALHKAYGHLTGQGNLANIPFCHLPFFERNMGDSAPLFDAYEQRGAVMVRHDKLQGSSEQRDEQVYAEALSQIQAGRDVVVTFGNLDVVGHHWGPHSDRFYQQIVQFDDWCERLVDAFRSLHGRRANVVICSDHGMAAVDQGVHLDLERHFGRLGLATYFYFQDSVMLRVWVKSPTLLREIGDFLAGLQYGELLDASERQGYGVSSGEFGDLIFFLDEGKVFWPGWYGARFPAGMHGYHPELRSQQAVFAYCGEQIPPPLPTRSREMEGFVRRLIGK